MSADHVRPLAWQDHAACAGHDTNIWFPQPGPNAGTEARAICATCPVRVECLDYAIREHLTHGIFGGLSERQRRKVRRARRVVEPRGAVVHGVVATYRHRGCRCGPCRTAASVDARRRRVLRMSVDV